MSALRFVLVAAVGLWGLQGCSDSDDAPAKEPEPHATAQTIVDLQDLTANPNEGYEWFDFRPNVLKLILAGAAETQHIAVLWYTVEDGAVGLHYHSQTESVYVIDGTQTDGKGSYPTGTVYFNPPGSGHQISDSSGFFLLAYAAPPDFASTALIEEYEPIRIDTTADDLTTAYAFEMPQTDVKTFAVPLVETGGLKATFIETSSAKSTDFVGNYVLVLKGSCKLDDTVYPAQTLVVEKELAPARYVVSAQPGNPCLALGVSF
ncbi:MAG: cupin domain-containing protein [Polyangiaceae bacterium]